MVMLKIMQQYYSATRDERVIDFMTKYFRYQLATLPSTPLGIGLFGPNSVLVIICRLSIGLYNITGEAFLLDLGNLLHEQSFNFIDMFLNRDHLTRFNSIHCVNLAQGLKEPVIYYQQKPEKSYIDAVKKGLADIRKYNGQPQRNVWRR